MNKIFKAMEIQGSKIAVITRNRAVVKKSKHKEEQVSFDFSQDNDAK